MNVHFLSVVDVGELDSNWYGATHGALIVLHVLSDVDVGAISSYSEPDLHALDVCAHSRLLTK